MRNMNLCWVILLSLTSIIKKFKDVLQNSPQLGDKTSWFLHYDSAPLAHSSIRLLYFLAKKFHRCATSSISVFIQIEMPGTGRKVNNNKEKIQ